MVRRKNKKKRQIKKEGITINIKVNQPTTTKRRRRTSAPQKKQVGMNFRTGIDPNFRTFDPYIRSKVMEIEQNNNAIQGNYLLKLKAIEDGRQQDINNLNNLQTRYNQLQSNFLSLSYDYTLQDERRQRAREEEEDAEDAEEGKEYDFDEDGYGARGDGVDNSYKLVNKPALTGATNSVVNPSDNKVIDPEKEEKNIQIAFDKEVDSDGNISTPPPAPPVIARSFSQEGEPGDISIKAQEDIKEEISKPKRKIVKKIARMARDEAGNLITRKIGDREVPVFQDSKGKYITKGATTKLYIREEKKEIGKTDKGIAETEKVIVSPITEKKRGVKKGEIRGRYYTFPQREKYSKEVFDRMVRGELSENEAFNLDESVEYRKKRRAEYSGEKGGGK